MPFTVTIQALLRAIPGCRAIAFVDLSARLVLKSEAQEPLPQDYYDALCLCGARLLGGQAAAASTEVFGIDQPPREAVPMRDGGIEFSCGRRAIPTRRFAPWSDRIPGSKPRCRRCAGPSPKSSRSRRATPGTTRGAAEAVDITESPPATMRAKLKPRQ
ncbi:hypothetical protein [Rhodovulum sulfidophilum]|uniref:hypothetical protein n=1 Tax=Rhodovulum sulfidophilum TaxID=35806 RepID=UPI00117B6293|nr:hypothetical protein [Rhodovulum sulfidophilum]MBL3552083.1 hypothetical protein [Rhodovulum sulfidophilum]